MIIQTCTTIEQIDIAEILRKGIANFEKKYHIKPHKIIMPYDLHLALTASGQAKVRNCAWSISDDNGATIYEFEDIPIYVTTNVYSTISFEGRIKIDDEEGDGHCVFI